MIEKLTIEATIPTVQYGNVKPTVYLEGDDFEEMRDQGVRRIKEISDMVAGEGYTFEVRGLPVSSGRTTMSTEPAETEFTSLLLHETTKVRESNGHITIPGYLSGSRFPERFYQPFDSEGILEAIVKKHGVTAAEVSAMWKLNNEASTGYGTAIHAALENYDKNRELGHKIRASKSKKAGIEYGPNKALSKNPFLKYVVETFQEVAGDDSRIMTEEFIWDHEKKLCGSIDRIKIIDMGKKVIRIQDYKTDGDIHDKKYQKTDSPFYAMTQGDAPKLGKELLDYHWFQLSFYAYILQRKGYTVEGLDVFWLNPNKLITGKNPWEVFSREPIDLNGVL